MYKNFILTESEKEEIMNNHMEHGYRKPLNEDDQSQMQSDIQTMIQTGVIGKDIVPLPPNDIFDPNVFGSYHYYKLVHGNFFKRGTGWPIAYYRITQPEAIEALNNAKYNRGSGKPLTWGHFHLDKNNPGMLNLMGYGTVRKQNPLANRFANEGEAVLATIPTPKGVFAHQNMQLEAYWFKNDEGDNNIYLQFLIDKSEAEAYIDLMENVVKVKDIPNPVDKNHNLIKPSTPPATEQQPMNEAREIMKKTFNKFVK